MPQAPSRRSVLSALGIAAVSSLAGCSSGSDESSETDTPAPAGSPGGTDTAANVMTTNTRPYSVPGNEETFSHGAAKIENMADQPVSLSLTISHGTETFLHRSYDLRSGESVSLDDLTATAGEFTVAVDVVDGGRSTYTWHIPAEHNWPHLLVQVPSDKRPVVGCGQGKRISLELKNTTDEPQPTDLLITRSGETIQQHAVTIPPNTTTDHSFSTPIGDIYTLSVTTDAGTAQADIAECYCYRETKTIVTLTGEPPEIEPREIICD